MSETNLLPKRLGELVDSKFPGRGGRRLASAALGVTPSQLSRFINGLTDPDLPTVQRMAAGLGVGAAVLLGDEPPPKTVRPELVKLNLKPLKKPILGTAGAGPGTDTAQPHVEDLDMAGVFKHAEGYVKAHGDSMIEAGIIDGDWIGVRTTPPPKHGDIVVAWVAEQEGIVVKQLAIRRGLKCLLPRNDAKAEPIVLDEDNGDFIYGVECGLHRPPRNGRK